MKARLLIVDPEKAVRPPMEPTLILENEGVILLCNHDVAIPVGSGRLEDITLDDIRPNLRLRPDENPFLYLSSIRALPDDNLLSAFLWKSAQEWWIEEVTNLAREGRIPDAPAVKVTV